VDDPKLVARFIREFDDLPNADDLAVVGHDLKALIHDFEAYGAELGNLGFDTYVAAYLLEPTDRRYDLSDLALKYLDQHIADEETLFGKGKKRKKLGDVDPAVMRAQMAAECQVLADLPEELSTCLEEEGMTQLYRDIEMPLIDVLASMESIGFQIDVDQLTALSKTFETRIHELTEKIYDEAGQEFNINSTKQLGQILFEELQLPVIKKTKTGYSTSVEVLEQLAPYHDIVPDILEYRTVTKLDSTYGAGLIKYVDPQTHRVYSHFNQTVTATGRISSSDPNLQNIPVRTDLGREIRKVFIPEGPDRTLLDADYSQIELRVLAHLTGDQNLIGSFIRKEDIHARTASEIFGVPLEEVTREQRSHAKAINFGLIYGKQAFSLGKELGIGRQQAQNYIDMYFARYPKVQAYMEGIVEEAKEKGYVTTLFGRRRNIPEIQSRNGMIRKSGERIALNTPIQGTAADIMKMAMIHVYRRLQRESFRSHLILQIHDELIIDAPKDEADDVLALLIEEMENTVQLAVPLVVDAHQGDSWYAIK
jgi:DNA polymerase-1